jgi:hypothetical protein
MSLAMAGGASAAVAPTTDTVKGPALTPVTMLGEEEISDVSLGTFYVFDKELGGTSHLGQGLQLAAGCRGGGCGGGGGCRGAGGGCRGGGCGGGGCRAGGGCRGCGGGGCRGCGCRCAGGCGCGCLTVGCSCACCIQWGSCVVCY